MPFSDCSHEHFRHTLLELDPHLDTQRKKPDSDTRRSKVAGFLGQPDCYKFIDTDA